MNVEENFVYNNEEEAEMAQLHSIHLHMNAVARVRAELAKQALEPSLSECEECGEDIPIERQQLIPGVKLCVHCKTKQERR
jgi:RNA polymerase-binding transcription factor DksA